jgi:hypothetical protein
MKTCVICADWEHRNADEMLVRCPNLELERFEPVYLIDLGA